MLIAEIGPAGAALLPGVLQHCQAGAFEAASVQLSGRPEAAIAKERQAEDHA